MKRGRFAVSDPEPNQRRMSGVKNGKGDFALLPLRATGQTVHPGEGSGVGATMMLDSSIAAQLNSDDDPDLWEVATHAILAEAAFVSREATEDVFAQIGCCRHWIRPHQIRWTADGGFAWPFGYDQTTTGYSFSALPALDWSVFFQWTGNGWELGRTGGRCLLLRIAIPARTKKHLQAAVHTIWTPRSPLSMEKVVQLFGFRKKERNWKLTSTQVL